MLAQLAAIADLIAAAGVIASLLFLAFELRIQNRETGLSNWRHLLESLTNFKATTNDLAMADLIVRGNADYTSLTPAEKLSYGHYLEQGIHIIGNFEKHSGTVPSQMRDLQLAVHNLFLDLLSPPGARQWWAEAKPRGRFMPNTVRTIEKMQEEGRRPLGPHL
ncbi:hypothetical protein [Dinoroseobacter sp. S124A]|uniref:hypothetical protein n=1 Tax=Dinoroseobacter sp. S124A TaxID=3415128 RepID=UPI003C7ACFEE